MNNQLGVVREQEEQIYSIGKENIHRSDMENNQHMYSNEE